MSIAIAAADLFGWLIQPAGQLQLQASLTNKHRMWLADPHPEPVDPTVFDRLEIGLTQVKLGAKKNAQLFTRFGKKDIGVVRFKPVTIKKRAHCAAHNTGRHAVHDVRD